MSIALDVATHGSTASAASLTYSHTCTGSNLILMLAINVSSSTDAITAVTYNSVAMTLIQKSHTQSSIWGYQYYLQAPATGAHNVVISVSPNSAISATSVSYTGVKQSGSPVDQMTTNSSASSPITTSLTTTWGNTWGFIYADSTSGSLTAGTGSTIRDTSTNFNTFDSNGALAYGSASMGVQNSAGTTNVLMCNFIPLNSLQASLAVSNYTLTAVSQTISKYYNAALATIAYTLTAISQTITYAATKWSNLTKHSSSWTNQTKH